MYFRYISLLVIPCVLIACNLTSPTPQSPGTPNTACGFPANQNSNGLRMNCMIAGPLPNLRVDPLVSGNASCGLNSWTISGQTVNTPIAAIWGPNNDDTDARVRINANLGPGTHSGSMAKDNPTDNCATSVGASFAISTSFAGNYVALVDKGRNPKCVFESRLDLTTFTQTITAGVPLDISGMTKTGTKNSLQGRIDLEIASAVNRLLSPSTNLSDDFKRAHGRCENGWREFHEGD